jgi:hypothetical protein
MIVYEPLFPLFIAIPSVSFHSLNSSKFAWIHFYSETWFVFESLNSYCKFIQYRFGQVTFKQGVSSQVFISSVDTEF